MVAATKSLATEPGTVGESGLLTVKEAARYLRISERLLWAETAQNLIPTVRLGVKAIRYLRADLDRYVMSRRSG